jgi:hypothetical protein
VVAKVAAACVSAAKAAAMCALEARVAHEWQRLPFRARLKAAPV